jgi:hypothetical protein
VKRPLRHCDIIAGNRYKVIKRPEHLRGVQYPWINLIGVCKWVNSGSALISFGECKERLIPVDCLEDVEGNTQMDNQSNDMWKDAGNGLLTFYGNLGLKKENENKVKGSINADNVKLDELYRIIKVPDFWKDADENGDYPSLNQIGRLIRLHQSKGAYHAGTLKLGDGTQRFVPFECMEAVKIHVLPPPVIDLADDKLIDVIILNPRGALKIVKGLAKMNKDPRAVAFVQRGMLF